MNNHDDLNLSKDHQKLWYFHWWGVLIIILIILFLIFLVYFSFLVYNEYQNIKGGGLTNSQSLEKFLKEQKIIDPTDKRLDFSDDPYLGNPQAELKIIEFGDFQCPYCRETFPVIRKIANEYEEQIQLVYRDFPLSEIHPEAQKAAEAAGCATKQGKFWPYHDKLFLNQENLKENDLLKYAQELNLNVNQFRSCLITGQQTAEIQKDYQDGKSLGIKGTPTFFINGIMIAGSLNEQQFKAIIDYLLKNNN